jgi:hypothetical protein
MTRANDVQQGCDSYENLVVACHCGDNYHDHGLAHDIWVEICDELDLEFWLWEQKLPETSEWLEKRMDRLEDCQSCTSCCEFTWQSCDTCGGLAGERHALAELLPDLTGKLQPIYYQACIDCLLYCANGDLPEEDL